MARGKSGRVVVDLDPLLKQELHAELARQDITLKDWLIAQARLYIESRRQPQLFGSPPPIGDRGRNERD